MQIWTITMETKSRMFAIFEDHGMPEGKLRSIEWYFLDPHKSPLLVPPWMILTKRPMGCQYVNTHNPVINNALNVGDRVSLSG